MPTFSDILQSMVTYLQTASSKLSDFTGTSIIAQILSAIASVIDQIYISIADAKNQAFVQSATDVGLDAKGADYGVTRKQPTASQWYFSFTRHTVSQQNITIPAGTIITTIPSPGNDAITFATNADSYLPAGTLSVLVLATCQATGTIGNIAVNTQLLVGSAVAGIDGVQLTSLTNGTSGVDIETDDAYRQRILSALASKAQGTTAWYQQTALGVQGVQSVKVVPQGRGAGTVDVYIVGSGNQMPSSGLISNVQSAIDAQRIITDDAKVISPTSATVNRNLTVKVASGYDLAATQTSIVNAVSTYINNLGIGGGSASELYTSQIIGAALGVAGVLNVTSTDADISFSSYQLPVPGTINVTTSY